MDFTINRNEEFAFLNFHGLVMCCESDALRTLERTGDTEGAVRSHEPDTIGRHVSQLWRIAA